MFFGEDRLPIVQRMILADNLTDRKKAVLELLPLQRADFYGVFKAMKGSPVTIRTIDPPLHEFLPKREDLMVEIAKLEVTNGDKRELDEKKKLLARVEQLHEFNPMLGHRGVRLGITYPEITEMQTRAIIEAAIQLKKEGLKVVPEIMIPLVGHVKELRDQKAVVDRVAAETMKEKGVKIDYLVGTMIEVPRGAVTADEIAGRGAVLLVRHERPHADHVRILARRHRQVPRRVSGQEDSRQGSVQHHRHRRRRLARPHRGREGALDAAGHQARHLRRARRRSLVDSLLREGGPQLRLDVAVSRSCGPSCGRAGGVVGEGRRLNADGLRARARAKV